MKILYLHQYFATPDSNAGTRSFEVARRLVKNGHSVAFITSSAFLSEKYDLKKGWNYLVIEGFELHVLHLPYSNNDSYFKRIITFIKFSYFSTLKGLSLVSDVVLATSTPLTIAIPALIYAKVKKKPMVFEVRDLWPEIPISAGIISNPFIIKAAEWLEHYTYKNATRLIGLSPGMCNGIKRHGIDERKVTLATNSCDTQLFDVDRKIGVNYKKEALSFLGERKLVVYTGTFGFINDVGYMVELALAMKSFDDSVCFVAIGDGMKKLDIIDKARSCGVLNENLYILDPVSKNEIVKLLSAADVSLSLFGPITEMWHNSANKLFDALASATPVAINYGGWQKEFIEEYNCGLVLDSVDYIKSAQDLSIFLNDKVRLLNARKQCNYLAYHKYSRDIMTERIEKTLLDAIND